MAEQINLIPLNYVQDLYQKNQLRTRLDKKTDMIPEVNIISRKASIASVDGAMGSGSALSPSDRILGVGTPYENFRL